MALYSLGQRVRIKHAPNAPTIMWGREGTISFEPLTQRSINEGGVGETIEQQYLVRFDDNHQEDSVWEAWIEPI